jgi:hypothetical protein
MRVVISSLLALELTACSFTSMERLAGTHRPESMPRCSASMMPVVADVGLSVFFGVLTANAIAAHESEGSTPSEVDDSEEMFGLGIPMALATAASAWYGQHVRARCIDARARHEAWVVDHVPMPPLAPAPSTPPATVPPSSDATTEQPAAASPSAPTPGAP